MIGWPRPPSMYCAVLLAAFAIGIVGCGDEERAQVSGTLKRADGRPLVGARVIARSVDSMVSASGHTDSNGHFALGVAEVGDGVPPGEYQLTVIEDRGDRDHPQPRTIAAKYRNPSTSDLRVSAAAGKEAVIEKTLDAP